MNATMAKKKPKTVWAGKFQALRLKKGFSQDRAAEALDIPVATIRGWEQGRHTPPVYIQRLILRLLEQGS